MKIQIKRVLAVLMALPLSLFVFSQIPQALEVKEMQLSNGMTVWLNEDHSQPKVFGAVVVNAGAKDCPNTGIAHYFEHIMFKGTDEIGTIDYAKEKPWLDSIAACYDRLAATKDEAQRTAIQKDINRLSQKAGEYAIPNEFSNLISLYGGSNLNAGTSFDLTYYHNMFTPQYLEHWCLLNSDRLIHPVFRMFQGELETVYEEKNRESDDIMTNLRESLMSELFGTQPYAYPVIGSTENLKNPKLSDMEDFYKKYYVGCNMGIVLCGDFASDSIMPLLERTFGRIPKGVKPTRLKSSMPDITQERTVEVKLPIPLISLEAIVFKAPTEFDEDDNAFNVATRLLSNGNAGMIDSLMNENVLMLAAIAPIPLNDAGLAMMLLAPNLLAKTAKAENACLEQVKRVCAGDFKDEAFQVQKQELYRESFRSLETIDKRAEKMVTVMSTGHRWQEYIDKVNNISQLTKSDVAAAAKRYLDAPFVRFKKKMGNAKKDKMSQPNYTPVRPKNRNAESAYAKRMAEIPVEEVSPRLIDFEHDAVITPLGGQATLFTVKNPVNDLFELNVIYNRGEKADKKLGLACALLNSIGTDSLTRHQLGAALQRYGADLTFTSDKNDIKLMVTGVDQYFSETMGLVKHFLGHMKSNDKSLKTIKDAIKAEEKSLDEENREVLSALLHKIMEGDNSSELQRITYKEAKALSGEELIATFKEALRSHCMVTYSGTLESKDVERGVRSAIPVELSQQKYIDYNNDVKGYDTPIVYVYDMPKSRQTLFLTYDQLPPLPTKESRVPLRLLNQYLGGGMSSVLFQEVREFRSMAYTTAASYRGRNRIQFPNSPLGFYTMTGTQGDKTMQAVALVDSLLRDMPVVEKNFRASRQELINDISNDFPSFREMGNMIAASQRYGIHEDPNKGYAELFRKATMDDMIKYYETNLKNHAGHRVFGIVGNKKKLDLKALEKYGRVVILKEQDLFRK